MACTGYGVTTETKWGSSDPFYYSTLVGKGRDEVLLVKFNYETFSLDFHCLGPREHFTTSLAQSPGNKMLGRSCVVVVFTLERTPLQGLRRM